HRRPNTPDQFARIRRREEQAGVDVAQSERARYPGGGRRVVVDGYDSPCNQVPVLVQSNRNHRLNIQDPLRGVAGADTEIKVVLERHADEVCDGICQTQKPTKIMKKSEKTPQGLYNVGFI